MRQITPTYAELSDQLYAAPVTPYQRGFEDRAYLGIYNNRHRRPRNRELYDLGVADANASIKAVCVL